MGLGRFKVDFAFRIFLLTSCHTLITVPDQEMGQPPMQVKCNCNSTSGRTVLQKITPIDSMPALDYVRYIKEKWRIESVCNASLREWVFC